MIRLLKSYILVLTLLLTIFNSNAVFSAETEVKQSPLSVKMTIPKSVQDAAKSELTQPAAQLPTQKPQFIPFKSLLIRMLKALGAVVTLIIGISTVISLLKKKRPNNSASNLSLEENVTENPQTLSQAVTSFVKHKLKN